jgi:lipoprotein-releasing system ATP-binding protein
MLRATNISHSFNDLQVLKGVSLEVLPAEIVSIVGSSGAGKTTLLQILGTLEKPSSGLLTIDGVNPFEFSEKKLAAFRNQHIGFIFQFHQLLPEFTALENAIIPALIKGESMLEASKKANSLFEILGVSNRQNHRPAELSGGEQQRVSIARSLINAPKIVFADEPSGNLDSMNANELHKLFFDLREQFKQTFVIVTHNELLADKADRKLVMQDGFLTSN